jgi:hypothetical protein
VPVGIYILLSTISLLEVLCSVCMVKAVVKYSLLYITLVFPDCLRYVSV